MEEDPFAPIISICHPTTSQEAKLSRHPMDRRSEYCFSDSEPDQTSPSPDPTPSNPTEIVMISPPGSLDSIRYRGEDDEAAFHTPPEHHFPSSSSENQNADERVDAVRASESGMGVGPEAKKLRSMEDEETVPVGETEVIFESESVVNLGEEDGLKSNGKTIEDIDEFRYDGQRKLPESLKEKEKEKGLLDFVDILKVVLGSGNGENDDSEDDENEDFFAYIQRKGVTFPKPRWW